MTRIPYTGDKIGAFPVKKNEWVPNEGETGHKRRFTTKDAIRSEEILTDIQGGGSLRLRSYQDGGHLQIIKNGDGDLVVINKFVEVKEPGFRPKTVQYKYTKLTGEELGLAEKSMIQRSKEFIEGRIDKETFEKIKQLCKETQDFTKRFKWVKV